ncbi:metallophosphoesterase [Limosilactobacillus sp.]|jgi:calcineurin-like phosphoesterase family protein|uniref:metallophosphoesterase n=1 Tax=Limosilactobacillus sp. TaxID=2773925 RepID=UPI0025B7E466|nr:metallophosphoesterase [Limosilactobacillus sp.]MCH3922463.1 metallophosphoesterase [Limosilactobacillus sp.]MCH3927145.1 metallophosphoesterase [Limosilactobacillus sp.]
MQFVTADTHFFHSDLLGIDDFAPRPFPDVATMNQTIIDNWNAKVGEDDLVYHLGDIALYFTKPARKSDEAVLEVLNQLHGHLVLVKGNHDSRALFKYLAAHNYEFNGRPKFEFHDVGVLMKYDHRQYYLTHYPLMLGIAPQIINLHGHIHHYAVPVKENINVGVDSPEFDYLSAKPAFGAPVNFHEVEEMVEKKAVDFAKRH